MGINAMEEVDVKSPADVAASFIPLDDSAATDEEEEGVAEFGLGSSGHSPLGLLAKSASSCARGVDRRSGYSQSSMLLLLSFRSIDQLGHDHHPVCHEIALIGHIPRRVAGDFRVHLQSGHRG